MEEVRLQPMTDEMYHAYFREYQDDPDLYLDPTAFTPYVYDEERVNRYIQRQRDRGRKTFAIMVNDEMAGELILKNIEPHASATLSICMRNARWKDRGFGTQAEKMAAEYVFHEMDIPRFYADTLCSNRRSQHVLEKVGFRFLKEEGDFRYYCMERPKNDK